VTQSTLDTRIRRPAPAPEADPAPTNRRCPCGCGATLDDPARVLTCTHASVRLIEEGLRYCGACQHWLVTSAAIRRMRMRLPFPRYRIAEEG